MQGPLLVCALGTPTRINGLRSHLKDIALSSGRIDHHSVTHSPIPDTCDDAKPKAALQQILHNYEHRTKVRTVAGEELELIVVMPKTVGVLNQAIASLLPDLASLDPAFGKHPGPFQPASLEQFCSTGED